MSISKFIVLSVLLFASMLTGAVLGVPISVETVSGAAPGTTEFTGINVPGVRYPVTDNGQRHSTRVLMMRTLKEPRSKRVAKSVTVVYNPRNRQNVRSHSCAGRERLTSCSQSDTSSAKEEAVEITDHTVNPPANDVEPRGMKETPAWVMGVMMGVVVLSGVITTVVVSFQAYQLFREEPFEDDQEEHADIIPPPVVQLASDHSESLYPRSDSLETIDLNNDPINDTSSPPRWYNCRGKS